MIIIDRQMILFEKFAQIAFFIFDIIISFKIGYYEDG